MVDYKIVDFDSIFHALSNTTRRNIILDLAKHDLSVNELAKKHDMTLQAVSKHIHVLLRSGLITQTKEGRIRRCSMNYELLKSVSNLIEEYRKFWKEKLESLEKYLEKANIQEAGMESVHKVIVQRIFKSSRDKVFEAFSNPDIMRKWFFPGEDWSAETSNTFEVGGSYKIKMRDPSGEVYTHTGEYREIKTSEKIVFTWNSISVKDTVVTITFSEIGNETEVIITHDHLPSKESRDNHKKGWIGCVNNLKKSINSF
jgi:uncharacterized protein YndB with AHSA1/START domain/DNA-binding transcriptional ArsR family regulator